MLDHSRTFFLESFIRSFCFSLLFACAIGLSYSFVSLESDTPFIEVNMRITLDGKRKGDAHISILSPTEDATEIEGNTKEENLFFLKLGSTYKVVVSAPGYASKCLEFDATHPKAREGEFPCDIDLFENEESYTNNPPVVGQIVWNNFKKVWNHKKSN